MCCKTYKQTLQGKVTVYDTKIRVLWFVTGLNIFYSSEVS